MQLPNEGLTGYKRLARGFEFIDPKHREYSPEVEKELGVVLQLPKRATQKSAAYDIFASLPANNVIYINPGEKQFIPTNIKAYMMDWEVLLMWPRSSQGIKLDLMLANTTGVIDSDYCDNPDNDGHIGIFLRNVGDRVAEIRAGDRIAQCMFTTYLRTDNDEAEALPERVGGVGHTGR
ncbi:Deoxyuridine 5'-triphosphate nucleotidohydrolase [compost metagenome]